MENYIEFQNITKIFPGHRALNDVSFNICKGEIHALLGENGAGKSTLLNILHGMFPATEGKVFINSEEINYKSAFDAIQNGVVKVHQEINIVPELTVAQNMMLGSEITKQGLFLNKEQMVQETQELLDKLGCNFSAKEKMKNLSTGKKQMVQIAKALYLNAKIISFDEPTASLSDGEVRTLFQIINELKANGITIIYISHKLDEIFEICDRATVLRDGEYITTLNMKETTEDELIRNMVGRDVAMFGQRIKPSRVEKDNIVLKVENLSGSSGFNNINFELRKGEILGFFGLVGAMRTEVMRVIFGADQATSGTIYLNGKKLDNTSPSACVKAGIGLISENRKEEGFVKNLNNANNIALASIHKYMNGIFVSKSMKEKNAVKVGERVKLNPNNPNFMTSNLSGGNAQKVILGKWLSTNADVLIMDEPTKGIDIGAKAEIYKLMEELLEEGKSIIMISSELTEAMGMSDRIIVMREGAIVAEFDRNEFAEENIITYALGGKKNEAIIER
ncbi:monosaccharide ABC transporter ATP-binding protein (CUT2 family) [Alkalibaculum bacchi]|uniref:Monosaccharide ABC transporter ATP-binding protein (CUT2 family) n=1 Tax=Alkalibaculum bacchi TaxID=645887 RepID=A0A366I1T3_9FIRM|nr:sugar ABC transporter ATP-binding protein [Alkalibaculum bacchi]RBP61351.1 monosaccharide ABC transporter ATP-binding protein (CUT2 family) [Alkalibaculum bacchi]